MHTEDELFVKLRLVLLNGTKNTRQQKNVFVVAVVKVNVVSVAVLDRCFVEEPAMVVLPSSTKAVQRTPAVKD